MERSTPTDWPTTPWSLTAPESYILQHGPTASGTETFKIGVREMVVRGVLRIIETEKQGRPRQTKPVTGRSRRKKLVTVLANGAKPTPPSEQSLASLWQLYSGIPLQPFADGVMGVPMSDYVKQATLRYGSNLQGYATDEVLSALIDRHLYVREEHRILWIFQSKRVVLTPTGQTARYDLMRRLKMSEAQFGGWVDHEPRRALAFMGLSGASVLLMHGQYNDFQRLQHQYPLQTKESDDRTDATESDIDDDGRPNEQGDAGGGLDLGGINLGGLDLGSLDPSTMSFNIDFSSLDTIGSAFNAIDSAVESNSSGDSGGGGGDSSGGGNDGGGGGGDSGGGGGDGGGGGGGDGG